MKVEKPISRAELLVISLFWAALAGGRLAGGSTLPLEGAEAQETSPATTLPDEVELVNTDSAPTLRFPVVHYAVATNAHGKSGTLSGSKGWLEIDANTVRYLAAKRLHDLQEPDIGFEYSRDQIINLKMDDHRQSFQIRSDERRMAKFRASNVQHYLHYVASDHQHYLQELALNGSSGNAVIEANNVYTALIVRSIEDFSAVVADYKLKHLIAAPPVAVGQPVAAPEPKPISPPPVPPVIVLATPPGASDNETVEVSESPLIIRGVAMENSGMPTVTINGAPAALRPKDSHAAEFWSDPLPLKPGDNPIAISASNSVGVETKVTFIVRFSPKVSLVNPKGLDKVDIISLLVGAVPPARVAQIVKEHGVKFMPTADDLNEIRAAGGTDELNQAIQEAAPHP